VLAVHSGTRQSELLGLRWADVDFGAGRLTVSHTLSRLDGSLSEPKTARGRRTLHMGRSVIASMQRHRTAQIEQRLRAGRRWRDTDHVFTTGHGTPLASRNVTRWFQDALVRAGLPRQRFHDLRHASATIGIEGGESLYEVSLRLGHANISTTGDVYGHVTPAMRERSAARMDVLLTG
jgi:integrase